MGVFIIGILSLLDIVKILPYVGKDFLFYSLHPVTTCISNQEERSVSSHQS